MIEHFCYLDLVYQRLLSVLLRKGGLLPESFDCYLLLVLEVDAEVNGSKVSLAQPFFSLKKIVEVELVHNVLQLHLPLLDFFGVIAIKLLRVVVGTDELYASRRSEDLLLRFVLGPKDLKDSIKANHKSSLVILGLDRMVKDRFWGQHQNNRRCVIRLKVESSC